jgi:lactoylglutathione lyase
MMSTSTTANQVQVIPGRPTWQQTMLRIRDPKKSLPFYTDLLGFTLIDQFDFPQYQFSLYFLTTLPEGETYDLVPGTQKAHDYLWNMEGVALELTYNYGTEKDDFKGYHAGNEERDGFGHIAVNCDDVYAASEKLEKAGCTFKKKPDEGRMKGLAFVYDNDGYWVELVKRGENSGIRNEFNFSQTMLRVKDVKKSIAFYQALGMKVVKELHFDEAGFSLYYLASSNAPDDADTKTMFQPVLELTHNHGTENDDNFQHFNGNEEGRQGFGHVGFLVDDVYKACDAIRPMGYGFRKEPDGGSMRGLAFAYDPDGYSVEIIKRGGIDFGDVKKEG